MLGDVVCCVGAGVASVLAVKWENIFPGVRCVDERILLLLSHRIVATIRIIISTSSICIIAVLIFDKYMLCDAYAYFVLCFRCVALAPPCTFSLQVKHTI